MRRIAILDAPSNLGLRPPTETSVPGCAKAPGALRDHGLLARLGARDAGCLTPPRYDPGDWRPGDGVCHANEIAAYSRKLADRIGAIIDLGEFPVVLGGDCSIVLGSGLAMHRLGEAVGGRIGLVFVDGHSDFRHPGNASYVGAAAGEDLALVTGRGQTDLAAIEGRRPYFRDIDVVVMGIRPQDEYRLDLQAAGIVTRPVPTLRVEGAARSAQWARDQLVDCAGYWVHVDMDVLDPAVMPAVDAPEPGGIAFPELEILLAGLVDTPNCLGVEITVFDPDYDPDGSYAEEITSALVAGLTPVRHEDLRPDLVAARDDLDTAAQPSPSSQPSPLSSVESSPDSSPAASQRAGEPWPVEEHDPIEARRAAAAAASVTLAAAGMSAGLETPDGSTEEPAAPATTLLAVEEADEVEPFSEDPSTPDDAQSEEARWTSDHPDADQPPASPDPAPETTDPDTTSPEDATDSATDPPASTSARADRWGSRPRADWLGTSADRTDWLSSPTGLGTRSTNTPGRLGTRESDTPNHRPTPREPLGRLGSALTASLDDLSTRDTTPRLSPRSGLAPRPDPETPPKTDTPPKAEAETSTEPEAQAEVGTPTEAEALPEVGTSAEAEALAEVETSSEAQAGAGTSAEAEALAGVGTSSEAEALADAVASTESETPIEAETEPATLTTTAAATDQDPAKDPEAKAHSAPDTADQSKAEDPDQGLRPLGDLPQLDSDPLPATRPGTLRPREDPAPFTLPAQRPAFDLGPEEPADIA